MDSCTFGLLTEQYFYSKSLRPATEWSYPEVMNEYPLRAFFRRLSRECKFTITPHRFRHTVATHMMKSPERNLYAVKKLLGHVSITSTLEYIDESVDSLRDILETELM